MADKTRTDVPEQSHEAMRATAVRPLVGPASNLVQAAGGGLNLPGGERRAGPSPIAADHPVHEPIPGERDPSTATHREPGAMGGPFNGADARPGLEATLGEQTVRERTREGGGADGERLMRHPHAAGDRKHGG